MVRRGYLILLIPFLGALAQAPASEKLFTVEGTVVNSVTGAPLRKVELSLANGAMSQQTAGPQAPTATFAGKTDADGKFRFEHVPVGTYWLTAKKPGFADGRFPKGVPLRVSSGQEVADLDIRLIPHATLSGHVLDEDGEPFPGATVSVLSYSFAGGHRRQMAVDMARTNNKGEFSLDRVPPGHYFLCADVSRMESFGNGAPPAPADGSPETAYVGTYLPNTLDVADAQKVDVAAGAELSGFNIQLRKSVVVRVRGRLLEANGDPVTGEVMFQGGPRLGAMFGTMVRDPKGMFEFTNVQPGVYTALTIQMQGARRKMIMQSLVVPEKNVENLELGAAEATIQGKVSIDGDAKLLPDGFQISLTPGMRGVPLVPVVAWADKSGAFTLEHVSRTTYDLAPHSAPTGTYVKSVMFNDHESLGQELDCSALTAGTLRIVLGTDGAKVEVHVTSEDKPAPDATVVLVPVDPNLRFPETVSRGRSDAAGHLTLKDVPPGSYLAFAWEEVEDGVWFDPDFMRTETHGVPVHVGPRGSEQVELNLIPAAR